MELDEAISKLEFLDSDATIWIDSSDSWSIKSRVCIAIEKETGGAPGSVPKHFEYFLEVFLIVELATELDSINKTSLTNRVIEYAKNDA
ncbi:hypothetical protein SOPP22_11405 [Shewanella sp. OPT22]|nr:hypothetical protein SOPP22_11405 [Shewanella sp. OPT22]